MIQTDKTFDGKPISYKILSDGYEIYLDGVLWIRQRRENGKSISQFKTYEENCLMQIEEIVNPPKIEEKYTLDEAAQVIAQEVSRL